MCPVKEVKTALTIFPAWIQVLGHLSVPDTRNLSYSDYTLTRSPVNTILALTLSVPEFLSSVPLCPAPPLPGAASASFSLSAQTQEAVAGQCALFQ